MNSAHILVIEDSETTLMKLKVVLAYFGYRVTTHSDPQTALDWLTTTQQIPDLILSDVLMPGLSGIEFTEKVRSMAAFADIPVVLLTADTDTEGEIAGRKAGANAYLNKLLSAAELSNRIKAILDERARAAPREGLLQRAITVFSLRGGVGTTSTAINLTIALKQLWGGEMALWDMAYPSGHCGLMLNLNPQVPAWDWTEGLGEIHPAADLFVEHDSGIRVIPAPAGLAQMEPESWKGIEAVWPAVRERADYLVIDAGSQFSNPVRFALQNSDQILVLLSPDTASVKSALDALEGFARLGIAPERCEFILNNTLAHNPLNRVQIDSALGRPLLAEIPHDSLNFTRAISGARPLLTATPTPESGLALLLLAYQVSKKDMQAKMGDYSTPLLHKVRQLEWEREVGLLKW